jgi:ABC-type oligopeptide transport system substrate-binding subunit
LRAEAIMLSWQADYPDSHHWLADILGCRDTFTHAYLNSTRPCLEADTLLAQAEATHDPTARADLYAQIEEGLFSAQGEMPVAPLLIYARPMAFQSWVEYYARQAGPLRFDRWIVNDAP